MGGKGFSNLINSFLMNHQAKEDTNISSKNIKETFIYLTNFHFWIFMTAGTKNLKREA